MILNDENTAPDCSGKIVISKEVNGVMEVTEIIPTSFSKISKRNSKESSTMKISTPSSIVIAEHDMQQEILHTLKYDGLVSLYPVFGFFVDARLVNNGQAIIFDAFIQDTEKEATFHHHETFMVTWSDFENFYLLNGGVI